MQVKGTASWRSQRAVTLQRSMLTGITSVEKKTEFLDVIDNFIEYNEANNVGQELRSAFGEKGANLVGGVFSLYFVHL